MTADATSTGVGVLIVAHGERGGERANAGLARLCDEISATLPPHVQVAHAILSGEPSVREGVVVLELAGCTEIVVFPFFMSDGFFTRSRLPKQLSESRSSLPWRMLTPFGLDPLLPVVIANKAEAAAAQHGYAASATRLLLVGHGSTSSPASRQATDAVAGAVASRISLATVETAFLEETPMLSERIESPWPHTIVAGLFTGEGLHAREDVPQALESTPYHYLGAAGGWPEVPAIVSSELRRALALL